MSRLLVYTFYSRKFYQIQWGECRSHGTQETHEVTKYFHWRGRGSTWGNILILKSLPKKILPLENIYLHKKYLSDTRSWFYAKKKFIEAKPFYVNQN